MQDNTQKGIVDADLAVVFDEAQFSELVHEKIDPWACCADHLRQHLLRYFGKHLLVGSARQPFLAGVKELVDQILLDSDVPCQGRSSGRRTHIPVGTRAISFFSMTSTLVAAIAVAMQMDCPAGSLPAKTLGPGDFDLAGSIKEGEVSVCRLQRTI